ncbi:BBSome complex member BBS2-like [Chironomus tepperi]|uniref:BBSome complex member BBS2-like n=1 Tax=Chironomus tepperi TaxID=113505 RepID=UPI00391F3B32
MNCKPIFSFSIDMKLSDKGVVVGKYDAVNPSLTAITQSNKIIIHSPNTRYNMFNTQKAWSEIKKDIGMLSVNYTITSIATGKLSDSDKEYLAIGTETNILVYQVDDNIEVFFKDVSESVRCMTIGNIDISFPPLLLVGSNTTVKGYNVKGDEILWIVVSGVVNSITLFDFNRDNDQEIILGCNDKIRIYKQDKFIKELNENAPVTQVSPLGSQLLAFILKNGTVGVYEEHVRLWRFKSKSCATCLASYDLLGTGTQQIILGWEGGKMDIRDPRSGEVLMKLISPNKVVGLIVTNYRGTEKDDLICVTEQGEVQGYTSSNVNLAPLTATESNQIKDLLTIKQNLMLELTHYENNSKVNELIGTGAAEDSVAAMNALKSISDDFAVIPANTRLQIVISTDGSKQSSVEIGVSTNNSTIIKAVIIFADGLFPNGNETLIVHPPTKRGVSSIIIPIKIPKDEPIDVHIRAFVGSADGNQYHVFELNRLLPRFSMYSLPERITGSPKYHLSTAPESYVKFKVTERVNRFCMFINQNFLLPADIEPNPTETETFDFLKVSLICLRDGSPLIITFYNDSNILIQTENIELAGNIIQAIAQFMNVTNLESVAAFPSVVTKFRELFDKLQGLQESSNVLKTDTALKINLAKILVLRAEDAKVTHMEKLSSYYNELMMTNEELMTSFKIRSENYNEVQRLLTEINQTLYHAQRLRVGSAAAKMMSSYKEALEQKNIEKLVQIMEISG